MLTIFFVPALYAAWFRVKRSAAPNPPASLAWPQPEATPGRNNVRRWIADETAPWTLVVALGLALGGCATRALMPTPTLYTGPKAMPLFTDCPREPTPRPRPTVRHRRAPSQRAGDLPYTSRRARSMAFGSAIVEFGKN